MLNSVAEPVFSIERPSVLEPVEKENRRIQRIALPLPARIEVKIEKNYSWTAITRLKDISAFGAGFTLDKPVKRGRAVQMTIPMPRQLRSFDYSEPQYKIWGIVRRCISTGTAAEPVFSVGVAFTGKGVPAGHYENPSMLYDVTRKDDDTDGLWHLGALDLRADDSGLPNELRKQSRFHIPEPLRIEWTDDNLEVIGSEETVTENISLGGAAVFTSLRAEPGTFLRVSSERFGVTILSVVRGSRTGSDGINRLHLEFIDRYFPLEGVE